MHFRYLNALGSAVSKGAFVLLCQVAGLVPAAGHAPPTDLPKLLTSTNLHQPNGRKINVHLVNATMLGVYMLNQYLLRRNALTNEQREAEVREEKATLHRYLHFSWLAPPAADAERLATLRGFASAADRQAVEQLLRREIRLHEQEDPGFSRQSAADKLSAFQVIADDNRQSGRMEVVRLRSSYDSPR